MCPAWLALAGFWAIPFVHAAFLAIEFIWASKVNRGGPTPKARSFQCVRAWGHELAIGIKVFGWWQPFRSHALPDQWTPEVPRQSGVIFILEAPHHGTWVGRFTWANNGLQMRHMGPWVRQLLGGESIGRAARFACWYSNCDNILFPASSAMSAGAENRFAPGLAHLELALDAGVICACLQTIRSL